jgi:hypothetical protein
MNYILRLRFDRLTLLIIVVAVGAGLGASVTRAGSSPSTAAQQSCVDRWNWMHYGGWFVGSAEVRWVPARVRANPCRIEIAYLVTAGGGLDLARTSRASSTLRRLRLRHARLRSRQWLAAQPWQREVLPEAERMDAARSPADAAARDGDAELGATVRGRSRVYRSLRSPRTPACRPDALGREAPPLLHVAGRPAVAVSLGLWRHERMLRADDPGAPGRGACLSDAARLPTVRPRRLPPPVGAWRGAPCGLERERLPALSVRAAPCASVLSLEHSRG